jgi:hypothetical protein
LIITVLRSAQEYTVIHPYGNATVAGEELHGVSLFSALWVFEQDDHHRATTAVIRDLGGFFFSSKVF